MTSVGVDIKLTISIVAVGELVPTSYRFLAQAWV